MRQRQRKLKYKKILATRSLFNPLETKPSLCAYCRAPAKGFIYGKDEAWFGACSMDHLKKIKEGERLKNVAQMSNEGLDYAIKQTKEVYLSILDAEGEILPPGELGAIAVIRQ